MSGSDPDDTRPGHEAEQVKEEIEEAAVPSARDGQRLIGAVVPKLFDGHEHESKGQERPMEMPEDMGTQHPRRAGEQMRRLTHIIERGVTSEGCHVLSLPFSVSTAAVSLTTRGITA